MNLVVEMPRSSMDSDVELLKAPVQGDNEEMASSSDIDRFVVGVFPTVKVESDDPDRPRSRSALKFDIADDRNIPNAVLFGSEIVLFSVGTGGLGSARDPAERLASQGVLCHDGFEELWAALSHYFRPHPNRDADMFDPKRLLAALGEERRRLVKEFLTTNPLIDKLGLEGFGAVYAQFRCHALTGQMIVKGENHSWTPWQGVAALQQAIQSVCLPDVSGLPIAEILEIRSHCGHLLIPVRAELLRLSKMLRTNLRVDAGTAEIAREAAFLVQTDILPVIMEAKTVIEEELRKRDKEYVFKIARFVAIASLGFLLPDAIKFAPVVIDKAIDAVEAAHRSLSEPAPPTRTAQFVLKVRELLPD